MRIAVELGQLIDDPALDPTGMERAVTENKADAHPRLGYADYLEENG